MKHEDCLIEIHTEELPPKALKKLSDAFQEQIATRLEKAGLVFAAVKPYATPRRLAMMVEGLANGQEDKVVERKGPAVNAAYDKNGKPSKACEGFARSCGVDVSKLMTIKTEQGEWVGYKQKVKGKKVDELLPEIVEQAAHALPIPKRMRWGDSPVEFVRPVHSVILLYGKKVIKGEVLGCQTGNVTRGHRFHSDKPIKIANAQDYVADMKKGKVMVDFADRRELIREAAQQLAQEITQKKGTAYIEDALLDEVTNLVEWPVALSGAFDAEFLQVPKEVLISAMQDHQRYFSVVDKEGKLLPYFVFISNIKSKKPEQVVHGNERVLRARLSDAKFFFETDKKHTLESRTERLKQIVYQAKLGTLYDKSERLKGWMSFITLSLNAALKQQAERAAELSKTDLVTEMVSEFPETQGVMGCYYAKHDHEDDAVASALREQYMPRFAGDSLPESQLGQILALADRLDLVVGSFGINKIPTGDKDPFGLRRAALGIVRILVELKIDLDLKKILAIDIDGLYDNKLENMQTREQVMDFIRDRMRSWYLEQGVTPDVFASVAALDLGNLLDFQKRIHAVQEFKKLKEAEALAAANKRVSNILAKYTDKMEADSINPDYFDEAAESTLAQQLELKQDEIAKLCNAGQYDRVLLELASLREPVDDFFDKVMVMTDDKQRRENRILLLTNLRNMFLRVADIALLQ